MLNYVTQQSAGPNILVEGDLVDLQNRIQGLKAKLAELLGELDGKRDKSQALFWEELTNIPHADAYKGVIGLGKVDSVEDSVSETTAASIYLVKSLLTRVDALAENITKVNGKPLTGDVTLTPAEFGVYSKAEVDAKIGSYLVEDPKYVLKTATINGHPLSGSVTLQASDFGILSKAEVDAAYNKYAGSDPILKSWVVMGRPLLSGSGHSVTLGYNAQSIHAVNAQDIYNACPTLAPPSTKSYSEMTWPEDTAEVLLKWTDTINGIRLDRDGKENLTLTPADIPGNHELLSNLDSYIDSIYTRGILDRVLVTKSVPMVVSGGTPAEFGNGNVVRDVIPVSNSGVVQLSVLVGTLQYAAKGGQPTNIPFYDGE